MKEFKTLPKMKTGGRVKKYADGGDIEVAPSAWHVYDSRTGERANNTDYKNLKTASRAVDRLDENYGSSRYTVKAAQPPKPGSGGGGAGYVPGSRNPFDPDSPLNRKKGGRVTKKVGTVKKNK
jgi:hypothetical protein